MLCPLASKRLAMTWVFLSFVVILSSNEDVSTSDWFSGLQRFIATLNLLQHPPSQDCVQLRFKSPGAYLRDQPEMTCSILRWNMLIRNIIVHPSGIQPVWLCKSRVGNWLSLVLRSPPEDLQHMGAAQSASTAVVPWAELRSEFKSEERTVSYILFESIWWLFILESGKLRKLHIYTVHSPVVFVFWCIPQEGLSSHPSLKGMHRTPDIIWHIKYWGDRKVKRVPCLFVTFCHIAVKSLSIKHSCAAWHHICPFELCFLDSCDVSRKEQGIQTDAEAGSDVWWTHRLDSGILECETSSDKVFGYSSFIMYSHPLRPHAEHSWTRLQYKMLGNPLV